MDVDDGAERVGEGSGDGGWWGGAPPPAPAPASPGPFLARAASRPGGDRDVLPLWHLFISGRAFLLSRFEHEGRELLLARRLPRGQRSRRALTRTERSVARGAARGLSNAEIAFDLGLNESTVGSHASHAMRKLGVTRRGELIRFRKRTEDVEAVAIGGSVLAVLTPLPPAATEVSLSRAEREVFDGLMRGLSNREIAEERGVTYRTVANQVTSVLRKHRAAAREELLARILDSGFRRGGEDRSAGVDRLG